MKKVNLDITHRCTLLCAGCTRQDKSHTYERRDMTYEEINKILDYFDHVQFCGQVSDPIFHPNFIDFLKLTHEKNVSVDVHTAASHKPIDWYKKAFKANPNVEWVFGIDGLPKDSHKYRVNQDGQKLFDVMTMAKKEYNMKCRWQYIVFDYNEEDVFEAASMAKDLGISFSMVETERGKNENIVEPEEYNFEPKCLKDFPIGHSTSGHLLPCCWSDYYKNEIPELVQDHLLLTNNNVSDIVNSKEWKSFYKKLETNPPEYCKKNCGYRKNTIRTKIDFNGKL